MLVVYFVNYFIALSGNELWLSQTGWRLMFISECIPAFLLLILVLLVPESPRWLVMKGRVPQAEQILERITGKRYEAVQEIEAIRESLKKGQSGTNLLKYGIGIIVIGILLSIFQQFVGINVGFTSPEIPQYG